MDKQDHLSKKELNKLLEVIDYSPVGLRDRAIIRLCYTLSLKITDILSLRTHDISFEEKVVYIKGERVPLQEKILTWVRDYTKFGRPQLLHTKENNVSDYLFLTDQGNNPSRLSFNRRLRFLQNKITGKKITRKEDHNIVVAKMWDPI